MRNNNRKPPLISISESEFQMGGIKEKLIVKFDVSSAKMFLISFDNAVDAFEKYEDKPLTKEELKSYTGSFYSKELETFYTITLSDEKLYGYHNRFGEFEIQVLKKDVLNWSGMAISKFTRSSSDNITGFCMTLNRIRNLRFERM